MKRNTSSSLTLAISGLLTFNITTVHAVPPTDSDYQKDRTLAFVNERSGEVYENINAILCQIEQTKYSDSALLNQGWQRVLVDSSLCEERDSASNTETNTSSGSTSASGSKNYSTWVVKSERLLDPDAPHIVSAFVHKPDDKGGPGMIIQAKMTVTKAASEDNPIGLFTIAFKGGAADLPVGAPPGMKGILKAEQNASGQVVIRWAEEAFMGPDRTTRSTKAAMVKTATSGQGSVSQTGIFNGPGLPLGENKFNFQYDENFFKRVNVGESKEQCLSRTHFETSAWRYGLYDFETGSRIAVNSGFPVNTSADGSGSFGYLGYYGLFLPPGSNTLGNGEKIYKNVFEGGKPVSTEYTLAVRGGKLKKHKREDMTLDQIKNIPLQGTIMQPGQIHEPGIPMSIYRLTWDGAHLAVRAIAETNPSGPPAWQNMDPPQNIESFTLAYPDMMFYSQSLGGDVRIKLDCNPVSFNPAEGFRCNAPSGATQVYFFKITTVNHDADVPASLVCYNNCPKAQADGSMSAADPSYPMSFPPVQHDYTFGGLLLRDNGNPLELNSSSGESSFGFNSGALFEATIENMNNVKCDFNPEQICGNKAYELETFYTWETGPNNFNRLTLALDSAGSPVIFAPPLAVTFEYPTEGTGGLNPANIDARYAGTKFFLEYGGFGDLHNIPGKCSNPDNPTDNDPDCSKPGRRWVPEFTIPSGSIVSDLNGSYWVKPLEIEQRMSVVELSQCASLNPPDMSENWPTLSNEWIDPALGTEPNISTPPKVIGGVVQ